MTSASKWRAGLLVATVLVAGAVSALLIGQGLKAGPLSLVFERYSTDLDFYVQDVAFLRLTNSSDRTYYLAMTGGTNTLLPDRLVDVIRQERQYSQSHMVNCEFSDQANPMQDVSLSGWSRCVALAPHSAVRLRVALPPEGQKRRVAALCAELPSGPGRFWTSSFGLSILRTLPHSTAKAVLQLQSRPTVLRVWCDREFSHSDDRSTTK